MVTHTTINTARKNESGVTIAGTSTLNPAVGPVDLVGRAAVIVGRLVDLAEVSVPAGKEL